MPITSVGQVKQNYGASRPHGFCGRRVHRTANFRKMHRRAVEDPRLEDIASNREYQYANFISKSASIRITI